MALNLAADEQEIALENHADRQARVETDRDGERLSEEMERLCRTIETIRLRPLDKRRDIPQRCAARTRLFALCHT